MGVCSRRTQRLSGGAGSGGGAQPLPRAGPGTPRPRARQGPAPPAKLSCDCCWAATGPRLGLRELQLVGSKEGAVRWWCSGAFETSRTKCKRDLFFIQDYRYDMMIWYGDMIQEHRSLVSCADQVHSLCAGWQDLPPGNALQAPTAPDCWL